MKLLLLLILTLLTAFSSPRLDNLRDEFSNPSQTYGTACWWWWLNGNVDEEAISRDLTEMAGKGFYGAMVIDAGGADSGGHASVPAGPKFGSPEWCRLLRYALDCAEKHNLVIGMNIQSGWNLGGPVVTPEYAAKFLVSSSLEGQNVTDGNYLPPQPETRYGFYRDIAVLAFPCSGKKIERIHRLVDQVSQRELGFSTPDGTVLLSNYGPSEGDTDLVASEEVVDLTPFLTADGLLNWTPPQGEWKIVRIGYTCTGAKVSTCSDTWQGLVLDHLSSEAFDFYWDTVMGPVLEACGPHVGSTLRYVSTDSWEAGGMNWTPGFENFFREFNGYDILPWLAVTAGYVLDDIPTSLAFLADFRKTIGEAIATRHFGRFAERAHELGMGIQPESAGPHGAPFDGIRNYGLSDIVMSEFWAMSPHRPTPVRRFFLKQASSAAHIYGKRIIGAEAFTTIGPQWNDCIWSNQKPAFDHEICEGLNRVYFHTFTCSPASMGLPGQEYFAGTHFNPQITWWNQAGPYIDYLARVQALAQNGESVNEILYYYGDHVPNIYPFSSPLAPGYDYDVVDERTLLKAKTRRGQIVLPSGRAYRLLVLPQTRVLSPAALRQIERLVRKGATVLGNKPLRSVTLHKKDDFASLADALWGDSQPGIRPYKRGFVAVGISPEVCLAAKGVEPDCIAGSFMWIHYRFKDADAYFLSNQSGRNVIEDVQLRSRGKSVELWNPVTGEAESVEVTISGKKTCVKVALGPYESKVAVVSKKSGTAPRKQLGFSGPADTLCRWKVSFDSIPEEVSFDTLSDWTLNKDPRIRYYSGSATYRTTVIGPGPALLSLGEIKDVGIAQVSLNGKDLGVVWTWPFEVALPLEEGENKLEVTVINSWYNRLAFDQDTPGRPYGTSTNIRLRNTSSLSSSGLMGPVVVRRFKNDL